MKAKSQVILKKGNSGDSIYVTFSHKPNHILTAKIDNISQSFGSIRIFDIPEPMVSTGFWVRFDKDFWTQEQVIELCKGILLGEGYSDTDIKIIATPDSVRCGFHHITRTSVPL